MLLIYDFESNLNTNTPFGKVDDFEKFIKKFLNDDGVFDNLLVYYRHKNITITKGYIN